MLTLKTPEEIEKIREGGAILSRILEELVTMVKPGITTGDIDARSAKLMSEAGATPSFQGHKLRPTGTPFNSTLCTSINDEVVHAPAYPSRAVKAGDIIKLDIGLWYKGLCTDMAVTVPVGEVEPRLLDLIAVTKESMLRGIAQARVGGKIGDIGRAVDSYVTAQGFVTVKDLMGHGVGHAVHEEPGIPNFDDDDMGDVDVEQGMVLAIEPMVNVGREDVVERRDGWTIATKDKSISAHFEVTIALTDKGMEIMTPVPRNV